MEIYIGIMLVLIIIGIILYFGLKYIKNIKMNKSENEIGILINKNESSFPTIQVVENKNVIPLEKNKIKDNNIKKAIALIDNTIPNATIIEKNLKNGSELLNNNRKYFSTIKSGTENMMKVKGTNEVYGTQMIDGKFSKQTKFLEEDKMLQASGKNAIINAGFATASMIVGQYYMNEINNKLDDINDEIYGISDFLDSNYQGKLNNIISKMKEIIDYKTEILDNDFSRNKRYDEILKLESVCTELLGQANEMIKANITDTNINYKKYEKNTKIIYKWFKRQQLLQVLLLEIGNLRYVLAYGNESSKLSHTQYNNYLLQCDSINNELRDWHISTSKELGIDTKKLRRNGKFFKVKKNTIGKIKEDWAYHKLDDSFAKMIINQINIKKLPQYEMKKQDEVIKIQKYNGEYYNLISEK